MRLPLSALGSSSLHCPLLHFDPLHHAAPFCPCTCLGCQLNQMAAASGGEEAASGGEEAEGDEQCARLLPPELHRGDAQRYPQDCTRGANQPGQQGTADGRRKCSCEGSKRKNKRRRPKSPPTRRTEQQQEQKIKNDKKRKEITKPNHTAEWIREWLTLITQLDGTGGQEEMDSFFEESIRDDIPWWLAVGFQAPGLEGGGLAAWTTGPNPTPD